MNFILLWRSAQRTKAQLDICAVSIFVASKVVNSQSESYRETERELVDEGNIVESVFSLHFRWVVCLLVFCLFRRRRGDVFGKGLENCHLLSKRGKCDLPFLSFCAVAKIRHRRNDSTREKHVSLMQICSRSSSNLSLKTNVTVRPVGCGGGWIVPLM